MSPADYARALGLLRRRDPALSLLIRRHGPCGLADAVRADHFTALVRAIIFQQLSTKAASTIYGRVLQLMPGGAFTPAALAALSDADLKRAGVSRQKAIYLRDLCSKVVSGEVQLDGVDALDDEGVIAALTAVKGVGRWTAEMFLMFRLLRPDVLPVGDLGIQTAVQRVYHLRARPTPDRLRSLADRWRPYRSVACWYLWRSLDNAGVADLPAAPRQRRKRAQ